MAARSARSGGNSKIKYYLTYLKAQTNPPSRYSKAHPHQNTSQHFCHLNFPLRGNSTPYWIHAYFTTTTMHVRAAKALFNVIMHKIYMIWTFVYLKHVSRDWFLPSWQRSPANPRRQLQLKPLTCSMHDPLFTHGLLSHLFLSERQKLIFHQKKEPNSCLFCLDLISGCSMQSLA